MNEWMNEWMDEWMNEYFIFVSVHLNIDSIAHLLALALASSPSSYKMCLLCESP